MSSYFSHAIDGCFHVFDAEKASMDENYHRNIAIVLGCIAEKLAGPRSIALFTTSTLDYLISNLV